MRAELALNDLALLARVHEFDRVLEADDIQAAGLVQVIDHCGQRGRFAGTRGACYQHHPLVIIAEVADDIGDVELFERRHLIRDMAEDCADAGVLAKEIDPEASAFLADVGEIEVAARIEEILLRIAEDFHDVAFQLGIRQLPELDWHQVAVHAQHRRHADGEVDVRAALGEAQFQE